MIQRATLEAEIEDKGDASCKCLGILAWPRGAMMQVYRSFTAEDVEEKVKLVKNSKRSFELVRLSAEKALCTVVVSMAGGTTLRT